MHKTGVIYNHRNEQNEQTIKSKYERQGKNMKEIYVVTYEKGGSMFNKSFTAYSKARKFALKQLYTRDYPAVKISTCLGMAEISVETITRAN